MLVKLLYDLTCPSCEFKKGDIIEDNYETLVFRGLAEEFKESEEYSDG